MEINGIIVPDAGITTQYIPDPIGGWMYEVTSTIVVNQHNLEAFKDKLTDAKAKLAEAQSVVDELTPITEAFANTVDTEVSVMPAAVASSTKAI